MVDFIAKWQPSQTNDHRPETTYGTSPNGRKIDARDLQLDQSSTLKSATLKINEIYGAPNPPTHRPASDRNRNWCAQMCRFPNTVSGFAHPYAFNINAFLPKCKWRRIPRRRHGLTAEQDGLNRIFFRMRNIPALSALASHAAHHYLPVALISITQHDQVDE